MAEDKHKLNWVEIKAYYETGMYTDQVLADMSGYAYETISRKAKADKWVRGKHQNTIIKEQEKKAQKKAQKDAVDKITLLKDNFKKFFTNAFNTAATQIDRLAKKAIEKKVELEWQELKRLKILTEIGRNCKADLYHVLGLDKGDDEGLHKLKDALIEAITMRTQK